MADNITTFNQLKLVAEFADEDDRTLTLDNPRDSLTAADIEGFAAKAEQVLIGDKAGAPFTRFKSAKYLQGTVTKYDLSE